MKRVQFRESCKNFKGHSKARNFSKIYIAIPFMVDMVTDSGVLPGWTPRTGYGFHAQTKLFCPPLPQSFPTPCRNFPTSFRKTARQLARPHRPPRKPQLLNCYDLLPESIPLSSCRSLTVLHSRHNLITQHNLYSFTSVRSIEEGLEEEGPGEGQASGRKGVVFGKEGPPVARFRMQRKVRRMESIKGMRRRQEKEEADALRDKGKNGGQQLKEQQVITEETIEVIQEQKNQKVKSKITSSQPTKITMKRHNTNDKKSQKPVPKRSAVSKNKQNKKPNKRIRTVKKITKMQTEPSVPIKNQPQSDQSKQSQVSQPNILPPIPNHHQVHPELHPQTYTPNRRSSKKSHQAQQPRSTLPPQAPTNPPIALLQLLQPQPEPLHLEDFYSPTPATSHLKYHLPSPDSQLDSHLLSLSKQPNHHQHHQHQPSTSPPPQQPSQQGSFRAKHIIQQLLLKQKHQKLIPRSSFDYSLLLPQRHPSQPQQNLIYCFLNKLHRHIQTKPCPEEQQLRPVKMRGRVGRTSLISTVCEDVYGRIRRWQFGMESRYLGMLRQVEWGCGGLEQR